MKNKEEIKWLKNADVMKILGISKRLLQTYRDENIIGYSQVKGKIYYKQSDIDAMLENYYKPAKTK